MILLCSAEFDSSILLMNSGLFVLEHILITIQSFKVPFIMAIGISPKNVECIVNIKKSVFLPLVCLEQMHWMVCIDMVSISINYSISICLQHHSSKTSNFSFSYAHMVHLWVTYKNIENTNILLYLIPYLPLII